MSKYTGRLHQRQLRERPADFEEVYFNQTNKLPDLAKKYQAGYATIERWIDEVAIIRAERITGREKGK